MIVAWWLESLLLFSRDGCGHFTSVLFQHRLQLRRGNGFTYHHLSLFVELVEYHSGDLRFANGLLGAIWLGHFSDHHAPILGGQRVYYLFHFGWVKVIRQDDNAYHFVMLGDKEWPTVVTIIEGSVDDDVFYVLSVRGH